MSINKGSTNIGSIYLGSTKIGQAYLGSVKVFPHSAYPPIATDTVRLRFTDGVTPTFSKGTGTQLSTSPNVWDLTYVNSDWSNLLVNQTDLLEVIGLDATGVTNMDRMFYYCTSLTTVALFNTSSVTDMGEMFCGCYALQSVPQFNTRYVTDMGGMLSYCKSITTVPLFNTIAVTNMQHMIDHCDNLETVPTFDTRAVSNFDYMLAYDPKLKSIPLFTTSRAVSVVGMCYHDYLVESGALALYQRMSTQSTPPASHSNTFKDCGRDTTTGAAELAQIPSSWGGTGS